MKNLREAVTSLGYHNVKTYIQSGNIRFETEEKDASTVKSSLGKALKNRFSYSGAVILRKFEEVETMVQENPFRDWLQHDRVKLYVCFLEKLPENLPDLPLISEKEGLEVFRLSGIDLFVISRELKSGRFGFPNNFVEKELEVISTARNWNTLLKMV